MKRALLVPVFGFILVLLVALPSLPVMAQAAPPWLQVWYVPSTELSPASVEYRNAGGQVLASYTLASGALAIPHQGGGLVIGSDLETIPVFSPFTGVISLYTAPGKLPDTDTTFYTLLEAVPRPDGQAYAYGIMTSATDGVSPSRSQIFVATPGLGDDRLVVDVSLEAWFGLKPLGWTRDGSTLLYHLMPQGIGGYILFWQYQDVMALDVGSGTSRILGALDGYAPDLRYTATVQTNDQGVTGLQVTDVATGVPRVFPLPPLDEVPLVGGNATFSPSGLRVAYQVARSQPEFEKFWTVVVDLTTGQSRVVLEDEAVNYERRYGDIGGWLDDQTLAVGGIWEGRTAVIDVVSGALLREERGVFLGYAQGITDTAGFAPSGFAYAQCPGAPPSRLVPHQRGRVTFTDGTLTNVRQWGSLSADKIGTVPEGSVFTVNDGPICADGYAWWDVQFDDGLSGFVAEGDATSYYLEPWQ